MTKEEAKQKLRKLGYNVTDDNSVVTVLIAPGASMKSTIKNIKELLGEWGYNASFSIRQHKGTVDTAVEPEEDTLDKDNVEEDNIEAKAVEEEPVDVTPTSNKKPEKSTVKKSELAKKSTGDDEDEPKSELLKNVSKKAGHKEELSDDEYFDEEDSDMLLTADSIQFSLEDFGLDF